MTRPRLLDLFCGGGGAGVGYHRAGFDVVGVDLMMQLDYPFEFHLANALTFPLDGFDAVHASPPCKRHTSLNAIDRARLRLFEPHDDLIPAMRERLAPLRVPWVIENVVGAPMPDAVTYCGSSFGLLVRRHRLFESNVELVAPDCDHASQPVVIGVYGNGESDERVAARPYGGAGRSSRGKTAADALGVDWTIHQPALSQMIPPAYTEHIGRQLLEAIAA